MHRPVIDHSGEVINGYECLCKSSKPNNYVFACPKCQDGAFIAMIRNVRKGNPSACAACKNLPTGYKLTWSRILLGWCYKCASNHNADSCRHMKGTKA